MFSRKRNKNIKNSHNYKTENDTLLLHGGVSETVDLNDRADILYNHPVNTKTIRPLKYTNLNNHTKTEIVVDNESEDFLKINNFDRGNEMVQNKKINSDNSFLDKIKAYRVQHNINKDLENAAKEKNDIGFWARRTNTLNNDIYYGADFVMDNEHYLAAKIGSRFLGGYEADENLQMAFTKQYLDTPYARQHTVYNTVNEVDPFLREYVKKKIQKQLGNEYVYDIKGIFIDSNSYTSQRLAQNNDIKLFIKRNKDFLKDFGFIKQDSIQFTDNNFYNAIGKADIIDMYLTNDGEIVFYVIDTYDFNKNSGNPFVRAGRDNQLKFNLKPYFMIYSVKIDKNTAERYLI